jgi:hypothetical protein
MIKIDSQNDAKKRCQKPVQKVRYKLIKNSLKICPKSTPKMTFIIFTMGGSKIIKNRHISTSGTPDPQKRNFLKFSHFLQKLPTFRPPKSTPINDPINFSFPTKTPVLLLRWGSKNVTFWGSGGRTARTEKCRHYYIAKSRFSSLLDPHNFDHFWPRRVEISF